MSRPMRAPVCVVELPKTPAISVPLVMLVPVMVKLPAKVVSPSASTRKTDVPLLAAPKIVSLAAGAAGLIYSAP